MAEDVVITWSFAPVPDAVKPLFERPTRFIAIPTPPGRKYGDQIRSFGASPIAGILKRYAPGVEPLRVATLGFSESCQGVGGLLRSQDGGNINAAIAIDGIHTAPSTQVPPRSLTNWIGFARQAALGEKLCVITHSSIQPPYASTTATANYIWTNAAETDDYVTIPPVPALATGPRTINVRAPPANAPYSITYPNAADHMLPARRANGLVVLGWRNLDRFGYADHIWQAKVVLPLMIERFLAPRWNAINPGEPGASCFVGEVPSLYGHLRCLGSIFSRNPEDLPGDAPLLSGVCGRDICLSDEF